MRFLCLGSTCTHAHAQHVHVHVHVHAHVTCACACACACACTCTCHMCMHMCMCMCMCDVHVHLHLVANNIGQATLVYSSRPSCSSLTWSGFGVGLGLGLGLGLALGLGPGPGLWLELGNLTTFSTRSSVESCVAAARSSAFATHSLCGSKASQVRPCNHPMHMPCTCHAHAMHMPCTCHIHMCTCMHMSCMYLRPGYDDVQGERGGEVEREPAT